MRGAGQRSPAEVRLPEIMRLIPTPSQAPSEPVSASAYRPFFIAGIVTVLTVGCALGAVALAAIAIKGSFAVAHWTPIIWAHANSQLYGWVGFFVMGFSLQTHRVAPDRVILARRLATVSLVFMALGVGLRFAAEPLVALMRPPGLVLGVVSTALQAVAVIVFSANRAFTSASCSPPRATPSPGSG